MPNRDDLLRQLKADPATSKIPVIVMSVVDRPDVPAGVDAHVSKPVQHDPLSVLREHAAAPPKAALVATILLVEDTPAKSGAGVRSFFVRQGTKS